MGNLKDLPGLKVDTESALDATKKPKLFFDLSAGQTVMVRLLPHFSKSMWKETGMIGSVFFKSVQHFKMKDEGETRWKRVRTSNGELLDYIRTDFSDNPTNSII